MLGASREGRLISFSNPIMMKRFMQAIRVLLGMDFTLDILGSAWTYCRGDGTLTCSTELLRLEGMQLIDLSEGEVVPAERPDRLPMNGWPQARCLKTLETEHCLRAKLWMFRYAGGERGYFVQLLTWDPPSEDFMEKAVLGADEFRDASLLLTQLVKKVDDEPKTRRQKADESQELTTMVATLLKVAQMLGKDAKPPAPSTSVED